MNSYYVNKNAQTNGDHEVHRAGCAWLPLAHNRIYLGRFSNCHAAIREAKRYYHQVNGCKHCSLPCHTT